MRYRGKLYIDTRFGISPRIFPVTSLYQLNEIIEVAAQIKGARIRRCQNLKQEPARQFLLVLCLGGLPNCMLNCLQIVQ